ncbi:MAG: hypothetical protein LKG14_03560 [Prevotella sp.]|jgi:hypothetical protein|nr:hypothetical protein [uncultured Prevotella sp.]MCI1246450.1 hypothetical protein [Prevotella sp.]
MKKKLLVLMILGASTLAVSAATKKSDIAAQYIITDCGTEHQIATNASPEDALRAIDYWSQQDC